MRMNLVGLAIAAAMLACAPLALAHFRPGANVYAPQQSAAPQQGSNAGPTPHASGPNVDSPDYDANRDPPPRRRGRPPLNHQIPPPNYGHSFNTGANNDPNLAPDLVTAQRACMQNCMSGSNGLSYNACYHTCFE